MDMNLLTIDKLNKHAWFICMFTDKPICASIISRKFLRLLFDITFCLIACGVLQNTSNSSRNIVEKK
jgi:hypothetical protein